jgi:hypothetical protein
MTRYQLTVRYSQGPITLDAHHGALDDRYLTVYESRVVIMKQRWIVVRRVELRELTGFRRIS